MTTTTVLYHANCPDGYAAMFACWQRLKDAAQYLPVFYGQPLPYEQIPGDHDVYIVDFSYPSADLVALQQGRPLSHDRPDPERHIVVLDHHASAQRDLQALVQQRRERMHILFDLEESGATLTWKYFATRGDVPDPTHQPDVWAAVEHQMPTFFKYVRDRDLWRWQLPDSKPISVAYWMIDKDPLSIAQFAQDLEEADGYHRIVTEGTAMQRYADALVKEQAGRATHHVIGGHNVPLVNATTLFSEVGDYLCRMYAEAPFAAYYFDRKDGKRQWGLRSRGGFDCSLVAKAYGGGGHPGAAGFVTEQTWRGEQ